ncbi:hypothetical protein [Polaribacter marinaquae]|uniref:Anti-sigma factor n=1 Tax=Polaribacter marinaquae TaxID=1642819 RepID=A0ABZ2TMQ5_9FLAO
MKEENIKNLVEKYKLGNTTLEEEAYLFDSVKNTEEGLGNWANFVKTNKKVAPNNFNDKLWNSFEPKIANKYSFRYKFFGAVASVAVLITLAFYSFSNNKQSIEEKELLLNEARSMFTDNETIIFEDELIIVYTKQE